MTLSLHFHLEPTTAASAEPAAKPSDQVTSFEAKQGSPIAEHRSGTQLLVEAYIFIWIIAIVFVGSMWMRQRAIGKRLSELEAALDRAAAKADAADAAREKAKD